ncbi:MAG TPA: PQQ-dependent sugar dehydrogenase [Alphaproteobacteria bacterium]|nr:PQQ-dependent sugar dehydrogenase [Alphaproteobacteria bacterium]
MSNSAAVVDPPGGASLRVPAGFRVNVFRDHLYGPRWMAVAPNGDVILTETNSDHVRVLRDADGDGVAEQAGIYTKEITLPHGLALADGALYVSSPTQVYRFAYRPGDIKPRGAPEPVLPEGSLGDGGGHFTRDLALSPDGREMFIAVGSGSNLAEEAPPRATVQRWNFADRRLATFASGLRNPVGIAFYPGSDDLYVTVNERDGLGEELAPDYLTRIREGEFYGWPYAYAGTHPDPGFGRRRPDLVQRSRMPDLLIRAHSAPLGLVFYDGGQFPARYRGGAFIALHGSWNAARPRGYMVAFVPFRDGRPADFYESFAIGFWLSGDNPAQVMGRPAGLAVAKDGSLLVADDSGGRIWRISYPGR